MTMVHNSVNIFCCGNPCIGINVVKMCIRDRFKRVRVGVGANEGNLVNHVLGKFSKGERVLAEQGINCLLYTSRCV